MTDLRKAINDALDNHQERVDALYTKYRERERKRIDIIMLVVYTLLLAVFVLAMGIVVFL
jgi:TRAP-type mannitol/chloroaromatic compound transport system permease small subunit